MSVALRELILTPLKAHRRRIGYAVLALVCLACAQSGFLLAVKPLFGFLFADVQKAAFEFADILPPKLAAYVPGSIPRETVQLFLPVFLVCASLIKSIANYVYRYQQEALSLLVAAHYRDSLFSRIISQPFAKLSGKEPAHWMSIIMNDVFYLQTRFSEVASSLVKDGVSLVASLVVIALYSPLTAAVLLVIGPILMIKLGSVSRKISGYAADWQNDIAMLAAKVLDVRRRFGFIRSQKAESLEAEIFAKQNASYFETVRNSIALRASFSPAVEYIGFLVFAGIMAVINHDQDLLLADPTDMVAYLAAIAVLLKPMRNIGEQVTRYRETMGSLAESLKVFAGPVPPSLPKAGVAEQPLGPIAISRLVAGYGEGRPAIDLEGLSFSPGSLTAIIGASGSGKSTSAKTLGGLLIPTMADTSPQLDDIVGHCAYVSQFPFMFSESIRNNLLYGLKHGLGQGESRGQEKAGADLRAALEIADVWGDIKALPEGLDTQLGRVHANLSGGQLQRLAIARGILQDKALLVLDESTASVSEASEQRIITALKAHLSREGKIGIAITHRLAALELFDHIVWLADGKVQATGSYATITSSPQFVAAFPSA